MLLILEIPDVSITREVSNGQGHALSSSNPRNESAGRSSMTRSAMTRFFSVVLMLLFASSVWSLEALAEAQSGAGTAMGGSARGGDAVGGNAGGDAAGGSAVGGNATTGHSQANCDSAF